MIPKADPNMMAVGQAFINYEIVERVKKLKKKFDDTDWNALSKTQPIEYAYALRFDSMLQEVLDGKK